MTGAIGVSGPRGARGLIGRTGTKGAVSPADRQELLGLVQGQLAELQTELTAQVKRMGSLAKELDELRANITILVNRPPA